MKDFLYYLSKIAETNKLLIEFLEQKTVLNAGQNETFCLKFNENQSLMRKTALEYLIFKGKTKLVERLAAKDIYIAEHVKIVQNALLELRKETKQKFDKKYIQFINTNNY